ncbi:MAG: helix-hairpin-helix domain-containing protein [Lewinella sp.]
MYAPNQNNPWNYTRQQRLGLLALVFFVAVCFALSRYVTTSSKSTSVADDSELFASAEKLRAATATDAPSVQIVPERFAFDPNTVKHAELQRLGLSEKQATAFVRYREKVRFRRPEDLERLRVLRPEQARDLVALARIAPKPEAAPPSFAAAPTPPAEQFLFNPNTLPYDSLLLLGLDEREARALVKYRSYRPVTFRQAEDLRRVSAIDSNKVDDLLALVDLPVPEVRFSPAPRRPKNTSAVTSLDVNSASAEEWQQLPGIGAYRAGSIVKFRDQLGGFAVVDQIGETYGLPDSTYRAILPYLRVSPVTRPLYVNRTDAATLAAHPYLKRATATIIVRYRDNHGPFQSVEDLKKVRAISTETLDKLLPYLNFAP